jgi:two-component system, OmpR family, sensor histidine kinase VicK
VVLSLARAATGEVCVRDWTQVPWRRFGHAVRTRLRQLRAQLVGSQHAARATSAELAAEVTARQAMAVLDGLPGLVVVTDVAGHIRHVNRQAQAAFGYTLDEVAGRPIALLLPDQATSRSSNGARRDGTTFMAEVAVASLDADGEIVLAHLITDVSGSRERFRQQEDFFANVAHEVRMPLTTIRASVEVLVDALDGELPPQLGKLLLNVDRETQRLGTMIDDLLDLNSIQGRHNHFRPRQYDLREVASGAVRAIAPLLEQAGQRLYLDLPGVPVWSVVDADLLERALLNLLGNAHKYGRAGGRLQVCLQVHHREAVFSVADDGPGIPPADRERIFQRLYRAATADGRRVQGNGLGLPLCRAAVELHGGRVWMEDASEGGSVFLIALPLSHSRCHADTEESA